MTPDRTAAHADGDRTAARMIPDRAGAHADGDRADAHADGDRTAARMTPDRTEAHADGDRADARMTPDRAEARADGDRAAAHADGDRADARMTPDRAEARADGDRAAAQMIRVRVARTQGSTPREAGAEMIVTDRDSQGTIGGGQLEYRAIARARRMLAMGEARARMDIPLGPGIGQCCGGRVILELDRATSHPGATPRATPDPGADHHQDPGPDQDPGRDPDPDPDPDAPEVLIFGAGHVGRALARALEPLPVRTLLVDTRPEELARATGPTPTLLTAIPEASLRAARPGSSVVILTHDHALDFLLAAEALARGDLAYVGMIGSATKRARFARMARDRGIDPAPLVCPIGAGHSRDKRPALIAAFTAAELMARLTASPLEKYPCDS